MKEVTIMITDEDYEHIEKLCGRNPVSSVLTWIVDKNLYQLDEYFIDYFSWEIRKIEK